MLIHHADRINMTRNTRFALGLGLGVTALGAILYSPAQSRAKSTALVPASMTRIGTVEERFQAYNVEMLEVTGGRFWKPYKDLEAGSPTREKAPNAGTTPAGMNPDLYQYRPPIDLTNGRLRKLAAALGPTYVRVSGTCKYYLLLRFGWAAAENTAERLQRCTYSRSVASSRRFLARRECKNHYFLRYQPRHSRCTGYLDPESSARVPFIYKICRW